MIRRYIIISGGKITKNDVVRYMTASNDIPEEYKTSRVTTLTIIDEFEVSGIIKVMKGKRKGQSHHLIINDKNEYNSLIKEIKRLYQVATNLDDLTTEALILWKKIRRDVLDFDFQNLIHLAQLQFYTRISAVSNSINYNILSGDDRKFLNLELAKVLTASDKLNKRIEYEVHHGVRSTLAYMDIEYLLKIESNGRRDIFRELYSAIQSIKSIS